MGSSLMEFENSGILRMIGRLSLLDETDGIVNHEKKISVMTMVGSLHEYAKGAYDDQYAVDVAAAKLDGDGIEVVSATRVEGVGILTISLTAPFKNETVTIRIPHGAYS